MRRKTLKSIACAVAMVLALSVTACGGSDDTTGNTGVSDAKVQDTVETEEDNEVPEVVDNDEDEAEVDDEANAEDEADEVDAEDEADSDDDADAGEEVTYASLEEAFADPEVKAEMDDLISSMEEDGMAVFYEVIGNEFAVTYQFTELVVDDVEGLAESLEAAMSQLEGVFVELAEEFDKEIGEAGACTVSVHYLDAADSVLYEGAFSAK